jgi:hypothetical protein
MHANGTVPLAISGNYCNLRCLQEVGIHYASVLLLLAIAQKFIVMHATRENICYPFNIKYPYFASLLSHTSNGHDKRHLLNNGNNVTETVYMYLGCNL